MKKRLKKLKSGAGETIAEALVAMLIAVLASMMLVGMVSSSQQIVTTSGSAMSAFYAALGTTTGSPQDTNDQVVISWTNKDGNAIPYVSSDGMTKNVENTTVAVTYSERTVLKNRTVTSYKSKG